MRGSINLTRKNLIESKQRLANGADELSQTFMLVYKFLGISALGAGLACFAGVTAIPVFAFLILDLAFLVLFRYNSGKALTAASYENSNAYISKAEKMLWGLAFTLGYGLSPLLSLANLIIGPTAILAVAVLTQAIVSVTALAVLVCYKRGQSETLLNKYGPHVGTLLFSLLLMSLFLPLMPNVSTSLALYAGVSAFSFVGILFLDTIKHLFMTEQPWCACSETASRVQRLDAAASIFLDVLNIFQDLLLFAIAVKTAKDSGKKPDLMPLLKSLAGLLIPVLFLAWLVKEGITGASEPGADGSDEKLESPIYYRTATYAPASARSSAINQSGIGIVSQDADSVPRGIPVYEYDERVMPRRGVVAAAG